MGECCCCCCRSDGGRGGKSGGGKEDDGSTGPRLRRDVVNLMSSLVLVVFITILKKIKNFL